jgi:RNA polymerase sigma-70 factor (sigma-E family)
VAVDAWPAAGGDARRAVGAQFGALFDAHYLSLCRLAYVLLGDAARAEDVVQEAFLRTFAGWGRLRQPDLAHVYLRKAVLNQCRSSLRRRVTEWRVNSVTAAAERTRGGDGFEERRALRLDVNTAVRALPPRQREAVVLRYFLDLGEIEIASVMGVNVGTVKSQLAKARHNLAAMGILGAGGGDG